MSHTPRLSSVFVTNIPILLLQLSAVRDGDGLPTRHTPSASLHGTAALRAQHLQALQHVHSLLHLAEHHVVAVQPGAGNSGDEELRAVGVGAAVRHGEEARTRVLQCEVLVGEALAVDGLTARAVSVREITSLVMRHEYGENLAHELGNDTMQGAALVVELLSRLADSLLSRAEAAEVLGGLGNDIGAELPFIPPHSPTSNTMRPMSFPPALKSMNTRGLSAREAKPRNALAPSLAETVASLVAASMVGKERMTKRGAFFFANSPLFQESVQEDEGEGDMECTGSGEVLGAWRLLDSGGWESRGESVSQCQNACDSLCKRSGKWRWTRGSDQS